MNASFTYPAPGRKSHFSTSSLSALPLFFQQHTRAEAPLLVISTDRQQAQELAAAWAFFAPEKKVACFPDWETLPYERFSPHNDIVSERLLQLWQLSQQAIDVLIVPLFVLMQKLAPPAFLLAHSFVLKRGSTLNAEALRSQLVNAGYSAVDHVLVAGEFAWRGGLIDLFPMGSKQPYRLDLFDDEIDSIKIFDPQTQRTTVAIEEIRLLPAHEFPTDEAARTLFRQQFREHIDSDPSAAVVYRGVTQGQFGSGVEYYLPLFFREACVSLLDYLGRTATVVALTAIDDDARRIEADIKTRYRMAHGDSAYPPLAPAALFMSASELGAQLKAYPQLMWRQDTTQSLPDLAVNRQQAQPLDALMQFHQQQGGRMLVVVPTSGRRETMAAFFRRQGIVGADGDSWQAFLDSSDPIALAVADFSGGFVMMTADKTALAVVTEADLYPQMTYQRQRRRGHRGLADQALRDLAEINVGDPVVHEAHGIGRYQGLVNMDLGEGMEEMLLLEYADGGRLYVPVAHLNVISRYAGDAYDKVNLHRLGGSTWDKAKQKAMEKARDTAAELLDLYARRAKEKGFASVFNPDDYQAFAAGFGYEETEDQARAIEAVIHDLQQEKPMDRLVCGDVGFGKTEVALRAAFVAAMAGKQVAVLAPTTLLVEQHAQVFQERFAAFAVEVAQISRFSHSQQVKDVLNRLAEGQIDIIIGTHKLIQDDIKFKQLGLVIIDEEHRFGVRQKEKLKQLRSNVDVLTLTATPIPRTLSMALEGLRDLSLIATAPNRRLAVKTFVQPFSEAIIREAMWREIKRGGQVFFLHNDVASMTSMYERLSALLPEARIGVAHGKLHDTELENVMRRFLQQQYNVLLCSTIIETGIDIPNANTIIINRADLFGIAQLHQLRGRVGRSHHQAYAYLLTPDTLKRDAEKRLTAIAEAEELGSGFMLAMQDLEIRGAGEILGEGQSGDITKVGLSLFSAMLKQAVDDLKHGRVPSMDAPLKIATEIKLHAPALLPEDYCPDVHERLVLYKRLAACNKEEDIDDIFAELVDRFGKPPEAVLHLMITHRLRLTAEQYGIDAIDASADSIVLQLSKHHRIDTGKMIALIQSDKRYRPLGSDRLRIDIATDSINDRVAMIEQMIADLAQK